MNELALKTLEGGYDLHIHTAPSHFKRLLDDFELVRELDDLNMAGAVIKSHFMPTQARAEIANKYAGGKAKLYGAVTLDMPAGGVNPSAVEAELFLGAKMVWLPTLHAKHHMENSQSYGPLAAKPISLINEEGKLIPEVYEIIALVKQYDAVLNTGHNSPEETQMVCLAALEQGIKVCITHPDNDREKVPVELEEAMAEKGAYIDRSYFNLLRKNGVDAKEMARRIRLTGAERCIMTTDLGQAGNISAPKGLMAFVSDLLDEGIAQEEIRLMIVENPKKFLGI
ncbi:MAG: hypothetical protein IJK47_04590 [Lachnospiraceae bacterium]|nr:hypothetical protein [Lachnospiraceae bacterium]